ncbi:transposase [Haloferula sp.]|uniref:transposase n=1 Tax=Haloferula sp. TaxID=2497595 RepID=UPI003C76FCF2
MAAKFVNIDHDSPMLLPPDLRDWVGPDHMVHFIMDAVDTLDLSAARVNDRGTGSAQYPPSMMLGLLIYCYATGTFSSRRIETLTYENVAVRYLSADTHPDHDSICKFRRENKELLSSCFHQVLELAAGAQVFKVGDLTVSVDGSKILANASKHSAMSHDHVEKQLKLAEEQIEELLAKAEDADRTPLQDGLSVPGEIKRREDRIVKLKEAKKVMEQRAQQRFDEEQAQYEAKLAAREAKEKETGRKSGGKKPEPPQEGPRPADQYNFTDPESRIMKDGGSFEQCFNVQAAVEVDTMLVVGQYVCQAPNDKQQLEPAMDCISPAAGEISNALADSGYYSEKAVCAVENKGAGPTVYAAMKRHPHGRRIEDLEEHADPPVPPSDAPMAEIMEYRLASKVGKELYGLRKQTVEPVFGIIKEVMGFRRFMLRGLEKVNLEWTLVSTSYNLKRLFNLGVRLRSA